MFDLGWSELVVIGVVTVVVLGPQELPRVIRTVRAGIAYIRRLAWDFQKTFDDLVREADLQDMKKEMQDLRHEFDFRHHAFGDSVPGADATLPWEPSPLETPSAETPRTADKPGPS